MTQIRVCNLIKTYDKTLILDTINLDIEEGEFTVLLGPSGCGKSTLLGAIAGLDDIDGGSIEIAQRDVTSLAPSERGIAMVFQSYALYPTMSVRKNLSFGLRARALPRREIERRIASVAELLQITALLDRKPGQLSGGQRQRVAIGRALVQEARICLFDEPLSNLDAKLRTETRMELKRLHQRLQQTILYVTHDQIEALTLATRVAVMNRGRIEQYSSPSDIYERPETLFVASFVGSPAINFLRGEIIYPDGKLAVRIGQSTMVIEHYAFKTPPPAGMSVVLGIRPEQVGLAHGRQQVFQAQLELVEPMGADTLCWFSFENQRISARLTPKDGRELSQTTTLAFDLSSISLFDPQTGQRI